MGPTAFIIRRFFRGLLTIWFVATLVFLATRLSGDPTDWLLPDNATSVERAEMRAALGVDKPLHEQYVIYFSDMFRGDFGTSFFERRPVLEVYAERLPHTLKLMGVALTVPILFGVGAGIVAAVTRNSPFDRLVMTANFSAYALPDFVLGIGLIAIFSLVLQWLPSSGMGNWTYYVMPGITLAASRVALIARLTRSAMLDVLGQDYVRTARAKGLREQIIIIKHCLRNALVPVLSITGTMAGGLVGGSVVVERVFAWPGAGRLIVDAVLHRDFPVLQFAVLAVSVVVVVANFLVDLGYVVIDPRIRLEG